jgi:hypothetical protein
MRGSTDLLLCSVKSIQNLSLVCSKRHEDFGSFAAHAHEANGRLGVPLNNMLEDDSDGVGLSVEASWGVVTVSTALAVVDNDHNRFKHHLDQHPFQTVK